MQKDLWIEEVDNRLIEPQKDVGNKWTKIGKRLTGRTEKTVKNHWNATKRRQNAKMEMKYHINSKGKLLHNYIMQVTTTEAKIESKISMCKVNLRSEDSIDLGLLSTWFQSSTGDFNAENWDTQVYGQENDEVGCKLHPSVPTINGNGGYVSLMVNADEMTNMSVMDDK